MSHYFTTGSLRTQVLYDVTADIWPGELVIVMGPSGSGKTTMLNLIGGLRRVMEGRLRLLGQDFPPGNDSTLRRLRGRIGFIFQHHHLLVSLTARQNVEMGVPPACSPREARQRADAMLRQVGLEGHEDANPKHLSGGQRQRVAVARALVRNPELLLADEPTASLDGQTGREIMELLRRLARQQGCAVLIVTHDSRILDMADRLMYLEDGRLSSFAPVTSAHAAHLLTALGPVAASGGMSALLLKMNDPEFLDMARTLAAESEQFLNVMDMGSTTSAREVVGQAMRALLERVCSRLHAGEARLWMDSSDNVHCLIGVPDRGGVAPPLLKEVMRGSAPVLHPHSLYVPIRDREHEISAVAEIRGEGLGDEAERVFRDYARPLGIMAQLYERLDK